MNNSSTRKNPYSSLGFGTGAKAMGSVRGQASAATRQQLTTLRAEAARQVIDFWRGNAATAAPLPPRPLPAADVPAAPRQLAPKRAQLQVLLNADSQAQGSHSMTQHVTTVVNMALARFGERVTRVGVHLSDADGQARSHPGQIQCLLQASLVGMEPVVVKHLADDAHQAIHGAVAKLKRAVGAALAMHDPRRSAAMKAAPEAEAAV
jgi:hypothetical protein